MIGSNMKMKIVHAILGIAVGGIIVGGSSTTVWAAGANQLPQKTVVIGTAVFPPLNIPSASSDKIYGFEPTMVQYLMGHIGVPYREQRFSFTGLIPALSSGRIDMIVGSMFATAQRAKVADFVPYLQDPFVLLVPKADHDAALKPTWMCGKAIGVLVASPQERAQLSPVDKQCAADGLNRINFKAYSDNSVEENDLEVGRLDGIFDGAMIMGFLENKHPDKFAISYKSPAKAELLGVALPKNSPYKQPLITAMTSYLSSASYQQNAAKWGLPDAALITRKIMLDYVKGDE